MLCLTPLIAAVSFISDEKKAEQLLFEDEFKPTTYIMHLRTYFSIHYTLCCFSSSAWQYFSFSIYSFTSVVHSLRSLASAVCSCFYCCLNYCRFFLFKIQAIKQAFWKWDEETLILWALLQYRRWSAYK